VSSDELTARFSIYPEPTDEEASVIVAAIAVLSGRQQVADGTSTIPKRVGSKWALAGRRSAHHSSPRARKQWSREFAWLERNER
jgi:hypothetical protein